MVFSKWTSDAPAAVGQTFAIKELPEPEDSPPREKGTADGPTPIGQTFAIKELPEPRDSSPQDKDSKEGGLADQSSNPEPAGDDDRCEKASSLGSREPVPASAQPQLPECGSWVMVEGGGVASSGEGGEQALAKPASGSPKGAKSSPIKQLSPSSSKGAKSTLTKQSPPSSSKGAKSSPTKSPSSSSPKSTKSKPSPPGTTKGSPKSPKSSPSKQSTTADSPKEPTAQNPASVDPMAKTATAVQQAWEAGEGKVQVSTAAVSKGEGSEVMGAMVVEDIEIPTVDKSSSGEVFSTPSAPVKVRK